MTATCPFLAAINTLYKNILQTHLSIHHNFPFIHNHSSRKVIKTETLFTVIHLIFFMEKMCESNIHFLENSDQDSCEEASTISNGSSSPSISSSSSFNDTIDDASSSSSLNSAGSSLHDLSDLMSQLPIKKGLSKFYQGKSESFTSLARVISIEDLPKKLKNPYNKMRKMKGSSSCKSYGGGLDNYKSHTLPKPIISKKLSSPFLRQRSFARSHLVPDQQNN